MPDNLSAFDAAEYDRGIRQTLPFYDTFYSQITDLVQTVFTAPVSWLDVGCGTGRMAEAIPESLPVERFVFCDVSEPMLRIARERCAGPRAEFCCLDVRELPFTDAFDVVTAVMVLHFLPREERLAALRRCRAALKPGGLLITFENFAPFTQAGTAVHLERWRQYQLSRGKTPEAAGSHIARFGTAYHPLTPADTLALLRESGFETAEALWLSNMQLGVWAMKAKTGASIPPKPAAP